jgi:diguanylate cyclase (GGDEF)-like protein/PAS domain S-box-containing protein
MLHRVGLTGLFRSLFKGSEKTAPQKAADALSLAHLVPEGLFLQHSRVALFLMHAGRWIDCNDQASRLLGCSRDQIIGRSPVDFSPERQPDGELSADRVEIITNCAIRGENALFEWQHSRQDGTLVDVELTVDPIYRGGKVYLLATIRDVSDRKRAELELATSHQRLRWLNQVSIRLQQQRSIDTVAWESVAILAAHNSAPRVSFFLIHDATNELELIASIDTQKRAESMIGMRHPNLQGSPDFQGATESDIYVIDDFANAPILPEIKALVLARGICSTVTIWLRQNGEDLGMICLEYGSTAAMASAERDDLLAFAKTASMALANARHIADMEFQATHDALTGLPNRVVLHRDLAGLFEQSNAAGKICALMLLDLDRFKEINDTLGHHVGDMLLREIGPRLNPELDENRGLLCRLGGDEFAIAVIADDENSLEQLAHRLLDALRAPFNIAQTWVGVGGSIGIALRYQPDMDSHVLLRFADVAMYSAKKAGVGVMFYDALQDEHCPNKLALMNELVAAISGDQLILHYQPQIDVSSREVIGYEALVRWNHPQRGLLMPDAFIPLAETCEHIQSLTLAVLRMALMQQQKWQREGLAHNIAVNLSARNLVHTYCIDQIIALIKEFRVPAGTLELEITETALLVNPEAAAESLHALASMGVRLSIDDFGTGYSSLSHLHRLPIHALKIDRTFTKDMLTNEFCAAIVKSTIALAHNLNMHVVAEGVEDEQTLELLRLNSCDIAQGYFISRPYPAEHFDTEQTSLLAYR